jgi:hypothetical protein
MLNESIFWIGEMISRRDHGRTSSTRNFSNSKKENLRETDMVPIEEGVEEFRQTRAKLCIFPFVWQARKLSATCKGQPNICLFFIVGLLHPASSGVKGLENANNCFEEETL